VPYSRYLREPDAIAGFYSGVAKLEKVINLSSPNSGVAPGPETEEVYMVENKKY
jgi:hypothetical protein